jgi:RNA polymerase sigma-70 factor (ECF subfamily)
VAEFTEAAAEAISGKTRATLLERLHEGSDPLAWEEFYQRYWPLIYAFAKRRDCSDHTAEEIVQEVMLTVFEQRDVFQYDPARGRFRNWLGVLVRNKVVQHRRMPSQRVRAAGGGADALPIEPQADDPGQDEAWEAAFEEALLLVLLDVLRREMRPQAYQAFELLTLGELTGAQVAKYTGLSPTGVYRAQKRALKRLRELGASYRENGRLGERLRHALQSRPAPAAQRSLTARIENSMRSRYESTPK